MSVVRSLEAVSKAPVIASDRRERGDLNQVTGVITGDCYIASLLAMTAKNAVGALHTTYETASPHLTTKGVSVFRVAVKYGDLIALLNATPAPTTNTYFAIYSCILKPQR